MEKEKVPVHYSLNIKLYREDKFFGPGVVRLLWSIAEGKSLRAAAAGLNMAYSKAWKLIKTAEGNLGFSLLDTRIGGADGGGADLTEDAKTMLVRFLKFEHEVYSRADEAWQRCFPEFPLKLSAGAEEEGGRRLKLPAEMTAELAVRLLPGETREIGK
ncbi:MAG: LysR family transcriptional regulator [Peptococcaceae bacterium]|nr:LysR family transcriptional regulator [Peptococcaceae bacterium]